MMIYYDDELFITSLSHSLPKHKHVPREARRQEPEAHIYFSAFSVSLSFVIVMIQCRKYLQCNHRITFNFLVKPV